MDTNEIPNISEYTRTLITVKARQLVGHYGYKSCDREDLEQELVLAVLEAQSAWDASRASRNTFDNRIVNRKIATMIRHRRRQCRDYRREEASLDESISDSDGTPVARVATLTDESDHRLADVTKIKDLIDLQVDTRVTVASLTPHQRRLCELLSAGSVADAARALGVSKPTVFKRIRLIREQFAKQGLEEYLHLCADDSNGDGVCDL